MLGLHSQALDNAARALSTRTAKYGHVDVSSGTCAVDRLIFLLSRQENFPQISFSFTFEKQLFEKNKMAHQ